MGAAKVAESLSDHHIRLVAALADVDPRTVRRIVIEGEAPRSAATRDRLAAALREAGFPRLAKHLAHRKDLHT